MSDLHVSGLRRTFGRGEIVAVDGVSFDVVPGEMLVLVGPSGCGKTTTLRCIAGLETPDAGVIKFGEKTIFDAKKKIVVPIHRRDIGLVFQNYALWPHLTGWENIAFPLKSRRVGRAERKAKLDAIAAVVDLNPALLKKRPGQLSGGQQQRVALARALVAEPAVVLFDEPLSNLDAALREQLRSELRRLHERIGFTGVYVTHDLSEAMLLGDRVAAMADGQIVQLGRPSDLFERPETSRIARMMGYRRLCEATSVNGRWDSVDCDVRGPVGANVAVDRAFELMARPDSIQLREPRSAISANEFCIGGGVVAGVGYLGSEQELIIEFRDRTMRLVTSQGREFVPGSSIDLAIPANDVRIFDVSSGSMADAGTNTGEKEDDLTNDFASR